MKITFSPRNRVLAQVLETERFVLRPMGMLETLRVTRSWRDDPEILTQLYHSPRPRSLLRWLRKGPIPNNVDRFTYAIVPKGIDVAIGAHGLKFRPGRSLQNTVALHDRAWWGKGVVTEVRARLMDHFAEHSDVARFYGFVGARNAASVFNYQRLGYVHAGTTPGRWTNPVTGERIDMVLFEMSREHWLASPFSRLRDGG